MNVFAISALQRWISFFSDDASHYAGSLPQTLSLLDRDTTGSPNRPLEGVLSQAQQEPWKQERPVCFCRPEVRPKWVSAWHHRPARCHLRVWELRQRLGLLLSVPGDKRGTVKKQFPPVGGGGPAAGHRAPPATQLSSPEPLLSLPQPVNAHSLPCGRASSAAGAASCNAARVDNKVLIFCA